MHGLYSNSISAQWSSSSCCLVHQAYVHAVSASFTGSARQCDRSLRKLGAHVLGPVLRSHASSTSFKALIWFQEHMIALLVLRNTVQQRQCRTGLSSIASWTSCLQYVTTHVRGATWSNPADMTGRVRLSRPTTPS
jgi:hypothetical protein